MKAFLSRLLLAALFSAGLGAMVGFDDARWIALVAVLLPLILLGLARLLLK